MARRSDPDDILQDAFLAAYRKWSRYPESGMSPYAWLYRITLDCLIETYRRTSRDRENIPWPVSSTIQLGLDLVNTGTSPSEALARAEVEGLMRRAVELLRPDQREVLWMRHRDGLRFKEISMILGISENLAIQRYHRALKQLRALWERLRPSPN